MFQPTNDRRKFYELTLDSKLIGANISFLVKLQARPIDQAFRLVSDHQEKVIAWLRREQFRLLPSMKYGVILLNQDDTAELHALIRENGLTEHEAFALFRDLQSYDVSQDELGIHNAAKRLFGIEMNQAELERSYHAHVNSFTAVEDYVSQLRDELDEERFVFADQPPVLPGYPLQEFIKRYPEDAPEALSLYAEAPAGAVVTFQKTEQSVWAGLQRRHMLEDGRRLVAEVWFKSN